MSASDQLVDLDALLAPVPGASAVGSDPRTLAVIDQVKAARKTAEADPTKMAGWAVVADMAAAALQQQSKDLQLSLWLLESLARLEGFAGAALGLNLIRGLLERYWDTLYPRIDPTDDEPLGHRAGLMEWMDERLPFILRSVPITGPPAAYTLLHYETTQRTGDEKRALIEEGWPDRDQFEAAMTASSLAFLESVLSEVRACQASAADLERLTDTLFVERRLTASGVEQVNQLLSLRRLREMLETTAWLIERAASPKRKETAGPGPSDADGSSLSGSADAPVAAAAGADAHGDQVWRTAREMIKGNRLEGLQVLQQAVGSATSGRDRFIRQLQLAELCLEAGVGTLALPVLEDLAKTIESRQLEDWEPPALVLRAWQGLERCCRALATTNPALEARAAEAAERAARLSGAATTARS